MIHWGRDTLIESSCLDPGLVYEELPDVRIEIHRTLSYFCIRIKILMTTPPTGNLFLATIL